MSMLQIHAAALSSNVATYHEFLSRYSKTKKVVYGFVEGKEDPCYYRGFLEHHIQDDWQLELWAAGNKKQVYGIHKNIDWRRFPKNRICFFVDRDLSDLIPERLTSDANIYVTDGYSIENDITNKGTCIRILTELCGFSTVIHEDLDQTGDLFEQEFEKFLIAMIRIMAWILLWRRKGEHVALNNIMMRDIFLFVNGKLQIIHNPKGKPSVEEYIHEQCNIDYDQTMNINSIELELKNNDTYKNFTRGKYVFWFLISFCLSVKKSMSVTLSPSNGMVVIGNRARIPNSLRQFVNNTYCEYITNHKS